MTQDLTLMNLMCARICHDLAAPAGAVIMGLEMFEESPQDASTHNLVNFSAQSTVSKIELFRCLTGYAGLTDKPTGLDVQKALQNYWPDQKISIVWDILDLNAVQGPKARLLLAALLTAADGLPRGGTMIIDPNLLITAKGQGANLREDLKNALTGQTGLSQQSAGTIVAYFAHTLAQNLGGKLLYYSEVENQFQISFVNGG